MEFILISEDKIKVSLTEADLEEFNLVAEELDYANTETKRMFWDVLSRAKLRTGFDTDGQKVLVQLYPSKDGGCEIFVTKIGSIYKEIGEDVSDPFAHPISIESTASKRKKKSLSSEKQFSAIYSFPSIDPMIRACRELERRGYRDESLAYISDAHVFYLVLNSSVPSAAEFYEHYRFISEFGEVENSSSAKHILSEHADVIKSKNAVAALALC